MKAIEIHHLTKRFGRNTAVDDVSFSVAKGEIFGFLGPNGAGKTTTIRCLMDFIRPTSGSVVIFGQNANTQSVALKRRIGFLPADVNLYSNWTGEDHIRFIERAKGVSSNKDELIKRLDFDPKPKVRFLSTGNKQKLGVILSLLAKPDLLIFDEPTRGFDPLLQNEIYEILLKFQADGGTVFMSSHNLAEVERICNQIGIIKKGRLIAVETMKSILAKRIYLVSVSYEKAVKKSEFNEMKSEVSTKDDISYLFRVQGDINPILKKLANHPITNIEISQANLEEMFFEYYKKG